VCALAAPLADVSKTNATSDGVNSLIVRFSPEKGPVPFAPSARASAVASVVASRSLGTAVTHARVLATGADLLQLDRSLSRAEADALATAVAQMPGVRYAVPNRVIRSQLVPTDELFSASGQWGFKYVPGQIEGANFVSAWDVTTGSTVQTIGIVDSGISRQHEELASQLRVHPAFPNGGYDFITEPLISADGDGRDNDPGHAPDACGHGTHVAGTIVAQTSFAGSAPGVGVAGGASASKVLMARALSTMGTDADAIDAMLWLAGEPVAGVAVNPNPVRIINMSFGGGGACGGAYQETFDTLIARGVLPVVAAGNSAANVSSTAPANCRGALAVAAADVAGSLAYFSNFGAGVAVTAPGLNILSTGGIVSGACSKSGTSMAAPHVTAAAALLQAARPQLTVNQTRLAITAGVRAFPNGSTCTHDRCGAGLLDARGALDAVITSGVRVGWNEAAATVRENDGSASFTVSRIGDVSQVASVNVNAVSGTAIAGLDFQSASPAVLNWAANDSSDKTVSVPINYRPGEQGERSFSVQLMANTPAVQVVSSGTAAVRITEVDCAVVTPIAMGETKTGMLNVAQPGDYCHGGVRGPEFNTVRYSFSATAGDIVSIDLKSTTPPPSVLDPYVYLLDANRRVLIENDDVVSGRIRDSRIQQFRLTSTGTHYIDVTTWGSTADATGSYSLHLYSCGAYVGGTTCNLDVDGDGIFDATDAQMALRRLTGASGATITGGMSFRACASRTDGTSVAAFVDAQAIAASAPKPFDIDGDGVVNPLTDGLMILRVALGLTGDAVVANAVAPGAPRNAWAAIRPYLVQQCGLTIAP
jgi:subtilisin family serine protease